MESVFSFTGKTVIVTGGGRGIGRAIALGFAQAGANVVVCSRTNAEIDAVAEEIRNKGGKALAVATDLTVHEQLGNLVDTTVKEFGRIDILVNNAARSFLRGLLDLREDGWDKCFNTNVKAVWLLSRLVARKMMEQKSGKIINITSMYGIVSPDFESLYMGDNCEKYTNPPHYGAAKAAMIQLTKYYAVLLGKYNIHVNAISPGPFPKEIIQNENPEFINRLKNKNPLNKIGKPEDLAGVIALLSSSASDFITGQTFQVDGGWTIW